MTFKEFKEKSERNFILEKLIECGWNKQQLAKKLKIQRSHIYNLIAKYNIQNTDVPGDDFLVKKIVYTRPQLSEPEIEDEYWVLLKGNKNYYISNLGRIKDRNDIFLKQSHSQGYAIVSIQLYGKRVSKSVHILVAQSFIPNPEGKTQVNHINMIRNDNRICNLEWVTPSENVLHSKANNKTLAVNYP